MLIQSNVEIPVEQDHPVAAIRQFVQVLRDSSVDTEGAEIYLNLVATSARGQTAAQEFRPQRTKDGSFADALAITEELTQLGPAKIKSMHFMLSAEGFRWKGSRKGTKARLALLDGKSLQRKQRFSLCALLNFEADSAAEPSIGEMLQKIDQESKLRFRLETSHMAIGRNEPGRATPDELFIIALVWNELIEEAGKKLRDAVSLDGIPHLMTKPQAMKFIFDPKKMGKSVKVDFQRTIKKWLRDEFRAYSKGDAAHEGEYFSKKVAPEILAGFSIEKKPRAFSKEFTLWVSAGLTSPRFAPAADRPLRFSVNLFRLFGIAPLPLEWTYETPKDLEDALEGAAKLLKQVLAIFEPQMACLQDAHRRKLSEFAGPRRLSAKEAYELALTRAHAWAKDASLLAINSNSITAFSLPMMPLAHPALDAQGRLAMDGCWWVRFHSRSKQENLYVTIPSYGSITEMRLDAPAGRQYPSDVDQILRDGWMDSQQALGAALVAVLEKDASASTENLQQFELSSRPNVHAGKMLGVPLRDGMFEMHAAWRVSFSRRDDKGRTMAIASVPAYGDGKPVVELHVYEKRGVPSVR